MSEQQTSETTTDPLDRVERITIVSDGGKGRRGRTVVQHMRSDDVEWLLREAEARRAV